MGSTLISFELFTTAEFIAKQSMGTDNSTINSFVVLNSKIDEEQRFSTTVSQIEEGTIGLSVVASWANV